MKLTKAQKKALETAILNGGVIYFGGLDKDDIRKDVIFRLWDMGFLHHLPPNHAGSGQPWKITPEGLAALKNATKA